MLKLGIHYERVFYIAKRVMHFGLYCDYSLLQNDSIISQFVSELCDFWEQVKSEGFTKKLDACRQSGQDLDERCVNTVTY